MKAVTVEIVVAGVWAAIVNINHQDQGGTQQSCDALDQSSNRRIVGGEQEQAEAVEQREALLKTKNSIMTTLLETLAKLELKDTALQQEQATSNLKQTVGAKVASLARSRTRAEAAEKFKNPYGLMGTCSRKLEEEGEMRMAIIIPVCTTTPRYSIFYFPGSSTESFSPYLGLWFRCFCSSLSLTKTAQDYVLQRLPHFTAQSSQTSEKYPERHVTSFLPTACFLHTPGTASVGHSQSPNNGILKNNCCNIPF